jgi:prepilin-type processing-associated H-X9-DG protein
VTEGGTREFIFSKHVFPHYQKISLYLPDLKGFVCPFETDRQPASSYAALNDLNLSFFLNADSSLSNSPVQTLLAGDRCLTANANPVPPGLFLLTTNLDLSWTSGYHANRGNFAFADGHAESTRADRVNSVVASQPLATNRLALP